MNSKLLLWGQQKIKRHRIAVGVGLLILVIGVALIIVGYIEGTGFNSYTITTTSKTIGGTASPTNTTTTTHQPGKTLWDWLQLLIIPVVLAVGGFVINLTISRGEQEATKQRAKTEREIAEDNQREAALQEYIDKMSELLLHEDLRGSDPEKEVRKIARVRTLTTLPRLDGVRKGSVLQFLHESKLIERDKSIVDLEGADLSGADLSWANLSGADLCGAKLFRADLWEANLSGANLSGANLWGANLSRANLSGADLSRTDLSRAGLGKADLRKADLRKADLRKADLSGANLLGANLLGAKVTQEQWEKAKSLEGATMPDGSTHA